MNRFFLRFYTAIESVLSKDAAQDLVEYAYVSALVGLGSVAVMNSIALTVGSVFTNVSALIVQHIH